MAELRRLADEPHTINKQKEESKAATVDTWAEHWHQSQRTSLAYQTADKAVKAHTTTTPLILFSYI